MSHMSKKERKKSSVSEESLRDSWKGNDSEQAGVTWRTGNVSSWRNIDSTPYVQPNPVSMCSLTQTIASVDYRSSFTAQHTHTLSEVMQRRCEKTTPPPHPTLSHIHSHPEEEIGFRGWGQQKIFHATRCQRLPPPPPQHYLIPTPTSQLSYPWDTFSAMTAFFLFLFSLWRACCCGQPCGCMRKETCGYHLHKWPAWMCKCQTKYRIWATTAADEAFFPCVQLADVSALSIMWKLTMSYSTMLFPNGNISLILFL